MTGAALGGATVYAKNLEKVSRFYAGVCGLAQILREPQSVVLENGVLQVVVVRIPEHIARTIEVAAPPVRREDTAIKLMFRVPDIAQARTAAADLGGVVDPPDREWNFQGLLVCEGHDPEGNVIQLRQESTQAAMHTLGVGGAAPMIDPENRPGVFATRRTLAFAPQEIYAAFADPTRLAKWWGPSGFTNTFDVHEFKVGGHWKFVMHGPDGSQHRNESVFDDLQTDRKVVVRHVSPPHFTLTVSLQPVAGGTEVHWLQAFEDAQLAASIRHIVEPANEQNLDRLNMQLRGQLD